MMTTMTKSILAIAFFLALTVGAAGSATAQNETADTGRKLLEAVFSDIEEKVIREWYDKRWGEGGIESPSKDVDNAQSREKGKGAKAAKGGKDMPPGLAKRDQLPPGLQKRLDVGEPLPPGLAKRDLPQSLKAQLPARTDQHEVKVIDNDVVLVDKTTQVLLDIIKDVFTPRHQTR